MHAYNYKCVFGVIVVGQKLVVGCLYIILVSELLVLLLVCFSVSKFVLTMPDSLFFASFHPYVTQCG